MDRAYSETMLPGGAKGVTCRILLEDRQIYHEVLERSVDMREDRVLYEYKG